MLKPICVERTLPQDEHDVSACRVRSVTVNLAESPLGWLKAHGRVSERQFAAGEQLRGDYERAMLSPHITMHWNAGASSTGRRSAAAPEAATHRQISAKIRFDGAIAAAGSGLADILWRVICAGDSTPIAEKALGWPTRSGRLVLSLALDRVADYYQLN